MVINMSWQKGAEHNAHLAATLAELARRHS